MTTSYVKPPPLQITITDKPLPIGEQWPYKWRGSQLQNYRDIDMNWDDRDTRLLLHQKLTGFGVLYIQMLEFRRSFEDRPVFMFRIGYTFDLKDPILFHKSILVRRPMYSFRPACEAIRRLLEMDDSGFCKACKDRGIGYVEATPFFVLHAMEQVCDLFTKSKQEIYSEERVRAILKKEGIDFDSYYLCPTSEDAD